MSSPSTSPGVADVAGESSWLSRLAQRLTALLERYLPDPYIFALFATIAVFVAGLWTTRGAVFPLLDAWGKGFFSLLPFTLQMALLIIAGHVLASAPSVARLLALLAAVPRSARAAVAWVTLWALLSSWLNWGFSLIFSALLARAVARRLGERGVAVDYRALCAASFLGLGSIWAQGLSGSAALQMATPGALPAALQRIVEYGTATTAPATTGAAWARWGSGVIPLSHTIFLWQSLLAVAIEIVVVTAIMWWAAPGSAQAVPAQQLGISLAPDAEPAPAAVDTSALRPAERLEHSRLLGLLFVGLGAAYLVHYVATARALLESITLNVVILALLVGGAALHGTPARFMRAFSEATKGIAAVLLQFPFYGGIAGLLAATALNEQLASAFVRVSTRATLPPLIALYSAVLGVLVPSGGTKWLIEAPYVLGAAHKLHVHLGWMVAVYDLGEALANLIQPFWMLPVLGILQVRARDVMGYTFLVFLILLPLVLLLTWLLGLTLAYPL